MKIRKSQRLFSYKLPLFATKKFQPRDVTFDFKKNISSRER